MSAFQTGANSCADELLTLEMIDRGGGVAAAESQDYAGDGMDERLLIVVVVVWR